MSNKWKISSLAVASIKDLPPFFVQDSLLRYVVVPRKTHDNSDVSPIYLVRTDGDNIYFPRQLFLDIKDRYKFEYEEAYSLGTPISLVFEGQLKPDQERCVNDVLSFYNSGGIGGILQAPPGSGKTVMALNIIKRMGLKTLVIVHKEFLVNQWKERIQTFTPNAKIGRIQQNIVDIDGKDIVIGMMQSLSMREYPEIYDKFGLVVIDEGHHLGAKVFHKSVVNFTAKYRLMLTATPNRADGCESVFEAHIGRLITKIEVYEMKPKVYIIHTGCFIKNDLPKEVMINILVGIPRRNDMIISYIKKAYENGRKTIVFSSRIRHLEVLAKKISAVTTDWGLFIGNKSQKELELASKKKIIFATIQMAKEGLDIPDLDCVIFATPQSNVEQDVGRALRLLEGKKQPVVIDFADINDRCSRMLQNRSNFYLRKRFEINVINNVKQEGVK
jgi:superfamily II DNA or RNA helicase